MTTKFSRRKMLKLSAGLAVGVVLTACAPQATQAPVAEKPTEKPAESKPTEKPAEKLAEPTLTQKPAPKAKALLTLRCTTSQYGEKASKNANDIVTPYVEKMFNMKFDVFFTGTGTSNKEYYALNKASGTLPDVMTGGRQESLF
jgi:hypothetical protein